MILNGQPNDTSNHAKGHDQGNNSHPAAEFLLGVSAKVGAIDVAVFELHVVPVQRIAMWHGSRTCIYFAVTRMVVKIGHRIGFGPQPNSMRP